MNRAPVTGSAAPVTGFNARISRRRLLEVGGWSIAGAAVLGVAGWGGGGSAGTGGEGHAVEHAQGRTRIPSRPERVVALDSFVALPVLLDAGLPVVGALSVAAISGGEPLPSYLKPEEVEGLEIVGGAESAPNLEAIAALEPDVIVGWSVLTDEPLYEDLSRIAPTVLTEGSAYLGGDWRAEARRIASWFGAEDVAVERVARYEERVAELRGRIEDRLDSPEVSALRITEDQLLLYYSCFWPGSVLADAGLRRPENQRRDSGCPAFQQDHAATLSLEKLREADAEAIFYYVGGAREGATALEERLTASDLWRGLEAVQNGRAFAVGGEAWLFANTRAAMLVLDDLERTLLEGGA